MLAADKVCRVCGKGFVPYQSMAVVCSLPCARKVPIITRNTLKAQRLKDRKRLDELRPLSYWMKQAQVAFNAFIRWRDRNEPCISCGRFHDGAHDAGHYLTVGARPELRFDEANVHKQCVPCNQHLHGNLLLYRTGLIKRIGQAEVDRLEGPHEPKRYRGDELRAIRDEYRARLKTEQKEAA